MKKLITCTASILLSLISFCQEFPGFRTGNYTGVNGVFFNPASVVDSKFRFDFNLFTFSTNVGNNKASFNLNDIGASFDDDNLTNQLFSSKGGLNSAIGIVDLRGPSLMFNTGSKMSIAISTRARAVINILDFDGPLGKQLLDQSNNDISFPYAISSNADMKFKVNAWSEFGFTLGRIISNKNNHFFKAGATLKYLSGSGNGFLNLSQLKGTLDQDLLGNVYLSNSSGRLAMGFGGVELSNFEAAKLLQFENGGIGADLGVVYEYRPQKQSSNSEGKKSKNLNQYKYKVGLALLDLGSVSYNKDLQRSGAYQIDITGNERFYLDELGEIDSFNTVFKSKPQYFTPENSNTAASYKVSLPATLQLEFDYNIKNHLFASLGVQLPLSSNNDYNPVNYSSVTLTPRYEFKSFSIALPINYNSLTQMNAGLSLRLGPLFVGSGSVLSALMGNSKQADVHVGLHIAKLK